MEIKELKIRGLSRDNCENAILHDQLYPGAGVQFVNMTLLKWVASVAQNIERSEVCNRSVLPSRPVYKLNACKYK